MSKQRRRSAAEWEKLVDAWSRSGQNASEFARARGVSVKSLSWWRWKLGARRQPPSPGWVEALVFPDGAERDGTGSWEVIAPGGVVVRGYEPPRDEHIALVLALVKGTGGEGA